MGLPTARTGDSDADAGYRWDEDREEAGDDQQDADGLVEGFGASGESGVDGVLMWDSSPKDVDTVPGYGRRIARVQGAKE